MTRVRRLIEKAWEHSEHPGQFAAHCQRPDCPAIAAYFGSRSWTEVRWSEMKRACGASWDAPWHFLPDPVFRYFLPAFLCLYLEHRRRLDVLGDGIVAVVCPHEGWRARVEALSDEQGAAVLAFLRHVDATEAERPECQAGIAFWERRLERNA